MLQLFCRASSRCRMAALFASLLAIAAPAAGMQESEQLPGPERCDPASDLSRFPGDIAPRVIGLPRDQAEATLASDGIEAYVIEVRSPEPRGLVVNQWPAPGEPLAQNPVAGSRFMLLCASTGEEPMLMPDLAGRTLEQARRLLAMRRIVKNPTIQRAENPGPAGTIYGQSPEAGAVVTADVAIVLNVSEGPSAPEPAPTPVEPTPAEPTLAAAAPVEAAPVEPAEQDGFVASEPPPSDPQRDLFRFAIPWVLLVIALLAAGLMTRSYLSQRRPRFRVRMAGLPMASVDWGDPPEPGFECRLVSPLGRCRVERDEGARADG